MYSSKIRGPMATCDITEQEDQSNTCCSLRCWLLIWAILRLIVSSYWTFLVIIVTIEQFLPIVDHQPSRVWLGAFGFVVQLVELGMIITFIIAAAKKSASLYRAYYRYCLLTLIIYIIAVILCLTLKFRYAHNFGDIYITYHINDYFLITDYYGLIFAIYATLDICLEIILIRLIKKFMKKYSTNEDLETV